MPKRHVWKCKKQTESYQIDRAIYCTTNSNEQEFSTLQGLRDCSEALNLNYSHIHRICESLCKCACTTTMGPHCWKTTTCLPHTQLMLTRRLHPSPMQLSLQKNTRSGVSNRSSRSNYVRVSANNRQQVGGLGPGSVLQRGGLKACVKHLMTSLKSIQRIVGVLALSALLHATIARPALAARSGGRMGGMRSFSSAGTSSSSYRSRMSHSGSSSSRLGLAPRRGSVQTNAFFFSPFGFGFGYGYPMGGGGFMSLLFWGVFAAIIIQAIRGNFMSSADDDDSQGYIGGRSYGKLSVAKVQVGLLSNARTLQRDLDRIASRADTSTPRGLHYVLQETVLALMRNPDYCVYGFAKSGIEDSPEAAESRFNKLSLEERGKFQKETRVNVGGMTQTSSLGSSPSSLQSSVGELIVVTILVAAEGRVRLPKATSRNALKDALSTLGSIPAEDIYAVEVLWTPEEEGDYFTTEDMAYDYPMLNTL